jgi:hypothetical protein
MIELFMDILSKKNFKTFFFHKLPHNGLKLIEIKLSENTHFIKKKFLEIEIVVEIEIRKLKMKLDETFFKCSILETCKIRTGIMLRSMKYLDICLEMIKKKDTSISLV